MEYRLIVSPADRTHLGHRASFAIALLLLLLASTASVQAKPIILVIFGDAIETFKEYPARQAPASFAVDPEAILKMLKYQQSQMHKD